MVLLTGPAGSGKTHRVLERLRDALRRRDAGVRLLTPTATFAQHLQNRMAHEGFVFRPALIQTLSRFVDSMAADTPLVSEPLLYLIVEEAARRVNRPEFARVVRLPGFCAALARTIEEFSSAGCGPAQLAAGLARQSSPVELSEAFLSVYREVDRELVRRALATRAQKLQRTAQAIVRDGLAGVHTIWLDGFYALPDPEFAVIAALCRHADVTVTLPTADITAPTRERLLAIGFTEENCKWQPPAARTQLVEAPSLEREADEIARRILESDRPFREIGVIVRSPETYEQVLRATLDRFGIPARFYFDADLERHTLIQHLAGIVDALLSGWDHAKTLAALRLAPGIPDDEFDFAVREQMPGHGLEGLSSRSGAPVSMLEQCARLEGWRGTALSPSGWVERFRDLPVWFSPPPPEPGCYEHAAAGRSQAVALELFDEAMVEAARALPDLPVSLVEFWQAAKSVLRLTPVRVDDARRNVVHVLGAHEARQWRLPVIFVCGLVEKQFPKFHTPDPFFPEAVRAQLKQAGIRVRTISDFEAEERFLFDWAVTRGTESVTLTYPRFDARSQQNLPSLFLEGLQAMPSQNCLLPPTLPSTRRTPAISSPDLLDGLAQRHQIFRPTALESYLQCPFQFFSRYTLRLRGAPLRPDERLDFMTQGSVVHAVLADLHREGRPWQETFDRVYCRISQEQHVPRTYRTEACRERMLADLHDLVEDPGWKHAYEVLAEQKFNFRLREDVEISGRIDRMDLTPDGGALVIDYKYSGAQNTKNRAADENLLQPQLYLLALERFFNLRPDGMSYWGFKGAIQRTLPLLYEPVRAIETTLRIVSEVRAGRLEPRPADPDKCRLCDYRDVCRFVAAVPAATEEASA